VTSVPYASKPSRLANAQREYLLIIRYNWASYPSLTCEHFLCDECLKKLTENAELSLNCPKCRRESLLDDLVPIHVTEQDRWDKLLEIA